MLMMAFAFPGAYIDIFYHASFLPILRAGKCRDAFDFFDICSLCQAAIDLLPGMSALQAYVYFIRH